MRMKVEFDIGEMTISGKTKNEIIAKAYDLADQYDCEINLIENEVENEEAEKKY